MIQMTKKRFLLYPKTITDPLTGRNIYINAYELARLYGVSLAECVIASHGTSAGGMVQLHVREDGNYERFWE